MHLYSVSVLVIHVPPFTQGVMAHGEGGTKKAKEKNKLKVTLINTLYLDIFSQTSARECTLHQNIIVFVEIFLLCRALICSSILLNTTLHKLL